MKRAISILGFSLFALLTQAQNTHEIVTMMQYNLLNYRNSTSQCNGTTNSSSAKDGYMKTIVQYTTPDIICANEIGSNFVNPDRLLTNALNTDGVTHYEQAAYSNNSFSSLVNMLFYNSNKFGLHSQDEISQDLNGDDLVRVIDLYTLYYKDTLLAANSDTTFITFIVAHLKAGNSSSDASDRAKATAALMDHLENNYMPGNHVFCGDFNVYTNTEGAIQNVVNPTNTNYRFNDPINAMGSWNNNSNYANVHTQSTRSSNTNGGCFSGGGMDDRFDMILISDAIDNNTGGVEYINNSYRALGQDGMRFNQTISSPQNNSLPSNMINALFNMSDHLPVVMDMRIRKLSLGVNDINKNATIVQIQNPVKDQLRIRIKNSPAKKLQLEILQLSGQAVWNTELQGIGKHFESLEDVATLPGGMYILHLTDGKRFHSYQKLLKINK